MTTVGKIGAAIKEVRGPAMLEAGIKTVATFMTADTPEEKAEGYGAAAGGMVGSVLGGVLGSFVPLIGPPIGALLGGMAGDAIGGWLGKRMASSSKEPAPTDKAPPVAAQPGDVVRSLVAAGATAESPSRLASEAPALAQPQQVTQQFTFTPNMPITVQGSVTDPMLLAQNLQAMVRRE
ncbi:MAG: phage tail tape measure protein, partial [Pseudomonas sp.]